jgi:hypothetical protein
VRSIEEVSGGPRAPDPAVTLSQLSEILLESTVALAGTGQVEAACRLAGRACVALRASNPTAARRFDALLHRLTPKLTW